MEILRVPRSYEDVYFEDPEENPGAARYRVNFDDDAVDALIAKVGNAIDRAQGNDRAAREASTAEERAEANRAQARLIERTVEAFVGRDGWDELLRVVGGGEAVEPERHIRALGEVFAQLMLMLGRHVSVENLTKCGIYYSREAERTAEFYRSHAKGGKKKGKGR